MGSRRMNEPICSAVRIERLARFGLMIVLMASCELGFGKPARELHDQGSSSAVDYQIDSWGTLEGLPGPSATSVIQTPDGYLWIGTFDGLARFDGKRFEIFDPSTLPGLPGPGVVALHLDARQRLWVGTLDGLAVRDGDNWRIMGPHEGWDGGPVSSFAERGDGTILLTTFEAEILVWDGARFTRLNNPPGAEGAVYGVCDREGRWWACGAGFIGFHDGETWHSVVPVDQDTKGIGCRSSLDGGVWIITGDSLRKFFDGDEVMRREIPGLPRGIWNISEDSNGNVWVSTYDAGVFRIDPSGRLDRWDMSSGLRYNGIRFVFEDREHNLWIGSSGGGLTRFKHRRVRMFGAEAGIRERVVRSVSPIPSGGLLVGTYGGGLYRLVDSIAHRIELPTPTGSAEYIQSVLAAQDGRFWVGGFDEGLFLIDGTGVRRIPLPEGCGENVIALFEDARGRLWVSGGISVAIVEDDRARIAPFPEGFAPAGVRTFAEDHLGGILFANRSGVFRIEGHGVRELLKPSGEPITAVTCLMPTADGSVWMGTINSGLLRWRENALSVVDGGSEFPAGSVLGILDDGSGFWWLATERGIIRVDRSRLEQAADGIRVRLECVVLGSEDGMSDPQCSGGRHPVCGLDENGVLWFATPQGVAMVDPAALRTNTLPPPVHITRLSYSDDLAGKNAINALDPKQRLTLPAGTRRVEFDYAATSLSSPGKVRFEIRLERYDPDWRVMGTRRSEVYYDLRPGAYTFHVRAANDDGVWNEEGTSLRIELGAHLWQTRWFLAMLISGLVGISAAASWGIAHWRFSQRRREQERLRHIVEAVPYSIFILDARDRIIMANRRAEFDFGYDLNELIGRDFIELLPERERQLDIASAGRIEGGLHPRWREPGLEHHAERKGGLEFPIEMTINSISTWTGASTLISIVDISDRKRYEQEQAVQQSELSHLSRIATLGELSGALAHELNQPLTAILSNAQAARRLVARDEVDLDEVREILDDIVDEDRHAGQVIVKLRAFLTKGEARHQEIRIADVIMDAARFLRSDLLEQGVVLSLGLPDELPSVRGDHVQLQQVLMNLVINAADAVSDQSSDRCTVLIRAGSQHDVVEITVEDSGPGIPPEILPDRIFEPFFTTKSTGLGLGLSICRTIVRAHGGEIRAENRSEPGACFRVILPVYREEPSDGHGKSDSLPAG